MKKMLVFLLLAVVSVGLAQNPSGQAQARKPVQLKLHPAKTQKDTQKYTLIPKPGESVDLDAASLYRKAADLLAGSPARGQVLEWSMTPIGMLPKKDVETVLERYRPALDLVEQASRCSQCQWPVFDPEAEEMPDYRALGSYVALEARYRISQGRYEEAIASIQDGFAFARHMGQSKVLVQGLVAIAIGGLMCRQIEALTQEPDVPSLYWALKVMPRPLVDLTEAIRISEDYYGQDSTDGKSLALMKRLDRHMAALHCIEGIRLYATRQGRFPQRLDEVGLDMPDDPLMDRPFVYTARTETAVVLEGPVPQGGSERDGLRYELAWIKGQ